MTQRLSPAQVCVIRAMQAGARVEYHGYVWVDGDPALQPAIATLHALLDRKLIDQHWHWPDGSISHYIAYSLTEAGKAWKDGEGCSE